ncbi:PIN domain-containing protein [Candidatus Pacearchaeota archaeon]|nr:PIN domain-containing protein [Candidatus Pacearchaeota archaeon]
MPAKLPKILIVDASILFSFFKTNSDRRRVIEKLSNFGCALISPKYVFEELSNNKERIKKFGRIDNLAFSFIFSLLDMKVESFSEETYKVFLPEANKISPHGKDNPKDSPYFALALALNCPIWSDEKAFKQQSKVKVYSTLELIKELGLK